MSSRDLDHDDLQNGTSPCIVTMRHAYGWKKKNPGAFAGENGLRYDC